MYTPTTMFNIKKWIWYAILTTAIAAAEVFPYTFVHNLQKPRYLIYFRCAAFYVASFRRGPLGLKPITPSIVAIYVGTYLNRKVQELDPRVWSADWSPLGTDPSLGVNSFGVNFAIPRRRPFEWFDTGVQCEHMRRGKSVRTVRFGAKSGRIGNTLCVQ